MIANPKQVAMALAERAELMQALLSDHEDPLVLAKYRDREDILAGTHSEWVKLAEEFGRAPGSMPLPSQGHIFLAAVVEPNARMLKRLLVDMGVSVEREWEVSGFDLPFSAWMWTASTALDDGAVQESVVYDTWTILLPHLVAAGMDLSLPMKKGGTKTRQEWLAHQDELRLEQALALADQLKLQWTTPLSCNTASRRL